jgi:hypothetical protein
MPATPSNDPQVQALRELSADVKKLNETVLLALGDKDRPGVLMVKLEDVSSKVDQTQEIFHGNPQNPGTGVLARLDRVEQKHQTWSKVVWSMMLALIGVIVKHVWDTFHKP